MKCRLSFDQGTLLLEADADAESLLKDYLTADTRVGVFRAPAYQYAPIMRELLAVHAEITDTVQAPQYGRLTVRLQTDKCPMPHQEKALAAWKKNKGRGVVVMPTGSGKTFFAFLAMDLVRRTTLVIVPTIDLLQQWATQLGQAFQCEIGMLGGGSHDVRPITVSTYDSAVLNIDAIGNQFGLLIFDECHHLPGPMNRLAASHAIAPYRVGLTATPDREDGGNVILEKLLGEIVCRIEINDLEGGVLAPYHTERIPVPLSPEEEREYHAARQKYLGFVRANMINFKDPGAWGQFVMLCARRPGGREVMKAFLRQRAIARCSKAKLQVLWDIIRQHPGARSLIFTADNDTAYQIGEALCLPVLTHKTKAAERKEFLEAFRSGEYPVLVTSKVLNEGVDVPEANIGIVVSGSGCIREHVQRLGRILRRTADGKQALLYELVSDNTSELSVSERRRRHQAYNGHEIGWEGFGTC